MVVLATAVTGAVTTSAGAATTSKLVLTSTAFANDGDIPVQYSCAGEGVSPPLAWKGVPKGTKELALVVDDPDAPSGTFTHWVLAGITPSTTSIAQGATPPGAYVGNASTGRPGYVPMCPPAGPAHHYVFTLYALKKKVELPPGADAAALRTAMKGKISKRAELIGLFART
jgi:Raf kinase inhibitor-like YbhB/YbcL family protein